VTRLKKCLIQLKKRKEQSLDEVRRDTNREGGWGRTAKSQGEGWRRNPPKKLIIDILKRKEKSKIRGKEKNRY